MRSYFSLSWDYDVTEFCPPRKNAVSAFQISCKLLFFYLGRFLKNLAEDQCSSITKAVSTTFNIMYIQPFITVVDWTEILRLMEVSMFSIYRYCVFFLGRQISRMLIECSTFKIKLQIYCIVYWVKSLVFYFCTKHVCFMFHCYGLWHNTSVI